MNDQPPSYDWPNLPFRRKSIAKINQVLQSTGRDPNRNPNVMESQIFSRANSKEEYNSILEKLCIQLKIMLEKNPPVPQLYVPSTTISSGMAQNTTLNALKMQNIPVSRRQTIGAIPCTPVSRTPAACPRGRPVAGQMLTFNLKRPGQMHIPRMPGPRPQLMKGAPNSIYVGDIGVLRPSTTGRGVSAFIPRQQQPTPLNQKSGEKTMNINARGGPVMVSSTGGPAIVPGAPANQLPKAGPGGGGVGPQMQAGPMKVNAMNVQQLPGVMPLQQRLPRMQLIRPQNVQYCQLNQMPAARMNVGKGPPVGALRMPVRYVCPKNGQGQVLLQPLIPPRMPQSAVVTSANPINAKRMKMVPDIENVPPSGPQNQSNLMAQHSVQTGGPPPPQALGTIRIRGIRPLLGNRGVMMKTNFLMPRTPGMTAMGTGLRNPAPVSQQQFQLLRPAGISPTTATLISLQKLHHYQFQQLALIRQQQYLSNRLIASALAPCTVQAHGMAFPSPVGMVSVNRPNEVADIPPDIYQKPPMPIRTPPPTLSKEEKEYLQKLECLGKYIQPLMDAIAHFSTDKSCNAKKSKLQRLLDILTKPKERVSDEVLAEVGKILVQLDEIQFGVLDITSDKLLVEALKAIRHRRDVNRKLHDLFQPFLNMRFGVHLFDTAEEEWTGSPEDVEVKTELPEDCEKEVEKKSEKNVEEEEISEENEEPILPSKIPHLVLMELLSISSKFHFKRDTPKDSKNIYLICDIIDDYTSRLPPFHVMIPENYPWESPSCSSTWKDYSSDPFLCSVHTCYDDRVSRLPDLHSLTILLNTWELAIQEASSGPRHTLDDAVSILFGF